MISPKRIATIAGTLFCAFAIGFLMQNYLIQPDRSGVSPGVQVASVGEVGPLPPQEETAPTPTADLPDDLDPASPAFASAVPVPPSAAPHPERLPAEPVTLAALDDKPIAELPEEVPAPNFGCEIEFGADPVAAAMVVLTLSAPCLGEERFTLHHNGMMFAAMTDENGEARVTVPALNDNAVFIATFASGASAVANAEIGTLEYYDRAVVQWGGPGGLQIHALEYGADYGENGHVWAGAARDLAKAARGEGGFITTLGDAVAFNPKRAQVYTFPSGTAIDGGQIRISLEAEVTRENCGKDISAQVIQKSGTARMTVRELDLAMPGCDAVGEYLVLKNMFDDLSIAGN